MDAICGTVKARFSERLSGEQPTKKRKLLLSRRPPGQVSCVKCFFLEMNDEPGAALKVILRLGIQLAANVVSANSDRHIRSESIVSTTTGLQGEPVFAAQGRLGNYVKTTDKSVHPRFPAAFVSAPRDPAAHGIQEIFGALIAKHTRSKSCHGVALNCEPVI